MEKKVTDKEKVKDLKVKDDIRVSNDGETKDEVKLDAERKKKHIPYDPKTDTHNKQNTVSPR